MKERIQEVQSYFKEKLLIGEFEIIKREQYTYIVSIDGEYEFSIWMENDAKNRKLNTITHLSFMMLDITDEDAIELDSLLVSDYKQFLVDELISKKESELETLKQNLR